MRDRTKAIADIIRTTIATHATRVPIEEVGIISVTDVEVGKDLGLATVYIGALKNVEKAIEELQTHMGEIRKELAGKLQTHRVPQIRFKADTRGERGARIDEILKDM